MKTESKPSHDTVVSILVSSGRHAVDRIRRLATHSTRLLGTLVLLGVVAVAPVAAQSSGTAFCNSQMAATIKNIFTLIQFGGPLIGGVVGLGATVAMSVSPRSDKKRELKELRNHAIIYGVVIASLGVTIIQFLMNHVVAGGASCSF